MQLDDMADEPRAKMIAELVGMERIQLLAGALLDGLDPGEGKERDTDRNTRALNAVFGAVRELVIAADAFEAPLPHGEPNDAAKEVAAVLFMEQPDRLRNVHAQLDAINSPEVFEPRKPQGIQIDTLQDNPEATKLLGKMGAQYLKMIKDVARDGLVDDSLGTTDRDKAAINEVAGALRRIVANEKLVFDHQDPRAIADEVATELFLPDRPELFGAASERIDEYYQANQSVPVSYLERLMEERGNNGPENDQGRGR
jgi:hypothetical protein